MHKQVFYHSMVALVPLSLVISVAQAQVQNDVAPVQSLEKIEVVGTRQQDDRRESTTAKIVVTRGDLDRYGDSSTIDVLRRVPGVNVSGSGRSLEIRMRGLGAGYTQILVNGEPVPADFTLDSISPNLIDRIEVLRSPSLEHSARGIAGTINIILRQTTSKPSRELKMRAAGYSGNPSAYVDGLWADRSGAWSYSLAVSTGREHNTYPSIYQQDRHDAAGNRTYSSQTTRSEWYAENSFALIPTLKWKPSETRFVSLESFLRVRNTHAGTTDVRDLVFGPAPIYASDDLRLKLDSTFFRNRLKWRENFANEASLDANVGFTINRRVSSSKFYEYDPSKTVLLDEDVNSTALERGFSSSGKYQVPYIQGHAAAFGWDAEAIQRDEDRLQRQTAPLGYPAENLDQNYKIRVNRVAFYAQDEWEVSKQISLYWGARLEMLKTQVTGNGIATAVDHQFRVLSPVMNATWKIPGSSSDQVRLGLSRTYKAPTVGDLNPRRFIANDNTATTPDLQGNPNLRPELAWGLDLAYEHYIGKSGGLVSVSAFARRIEDVVTRVTTQDQNGKWVSTPSNVGSADVQGVGLEAKLPLKEIDGGWPDINVRANINWNHSRVHAVPGPDNRLAKQTPFTMGMGADYRLPGGKWTMGVDFTLDGGGPVQIAAGQREDRHSKRNLDAYIAWKVDASTHVRFSGSNLLRQAVIVDSSIADSTGTFDQRAYNYQPRIWRVSLESKF